MENVKNEVIDVKELVLKGIKEVTIRHGEAPAIIPPRAVPIIGELGAPFLYIANRPPIPPKGLVLYSLYKMEIKYHENQFDAEAPEVLGKLFKNPDLAPFEINGGHEFTIADFIKLLRVNSRHFTNRQFCSDLIIKLSKFKATISTVVEKANDRRGNIKQLLEKSTEVDIPESFTLNMPIFIGEISREFKVNIIIEPQGDGVVVMLESEELIEDMASTGADLIRSIIQKLRDANLTCIEF